MHIPQIPDHVPLDTLPSLEHLTFTLDEPLDVIDLLGSLRDSRLRQFDLTCPYPTSRIVQVALANLFDDPGPCDSVDTFSWVPCPGGNGGTLTWGFTITLKPFVNMQILTLAHPPRCPDETTIFGDRHQIRGVDQKIRHRADKRQSPGHCDGTKRRDGRETNIGVRIQRLSNTSKQLNTGTPLRWHRRRFGFFHEGRCARIFIGVTNDVFEGFSTTVKVKPIRRWINDFHFPCHNSVGLASAFSELTGKFKCRERTLWPKPSSTNGGMCSTFNRAVTPTSVPWRNFFCASQGGTSRFFKS